MLYPTELQGRISRLILHHRYRDGCPKQSRDIGDGASVLGCGRFGFLYEPPSLESAILAPGTIRSTKNAMGPCPGL